MVIAPEMAELRDRLDCIGVPWESDDSEEVTDEWTEAILHIERTYVSGLCVSYMWIKDDEGKAFLSKYGEFGYLEVDDGKMTAMTVEEALECIRRREARGSGPQGS